MILIDWSIDVKKQYLLKRGWLPGTTTGKKWWQKRSWLLVSWSNEK